MQHIDYTVFEEFVVVVTKFEFLVAKQKLELIEELELQGFVLLVPFEKMDRPLIQKRENKELLKLCLHIGNTFASNVIRERTKKQILKNKKRKWQVEKTNKCKKNSQKNKSDYTQYMYFIRSSS